MTTARARVSTSVPFELSQDDIVVLGFLREEMESTGWTFEALVAEWKRQHVRIPDRQYLGKMLNGEKPIDITKITRLPDDLETAFLRRWCEHKGLMVITPVAEDDARRQLATGLFSLLAARVLPTKAGAPAKAALRDTRVMARVGGE